MSTPSLVQLLEACLAARAELIDAAHDSAFRLFNGFTEGLPQLIIDIYAATAIITNYADPPQAGEAFILVAQAFLQSHLPWLTAHIVKTRNSPVPAERRGFVSFGREPAQKVREHGLWYAVNPVVHQDAGLYLDTRNLRRWAFENLKGKEVLNTFAYTGSLGVAALGGGARRVVQLDHNQVFLDFARQSCQLNGFAASEADFVNADFFRQAGEFKRQAARFDCVFLDPPFFSTGSTGVVDQVRQSARLVNKVRPLIEDGGMLVAVNNALFLSGKEYLETLEALCADGYLKISEIIPVPADFTGYPETRRGAPISDPAPFNHSTKIVILQVKRRPQRPGCLETT